ncbi:serine/threonine-protein phosphatase 7 long form homolog [Helianthus annuus]|uniref:serine/threonine-protein phosphatase 7 long form homolog n=1 Tax=Helianthus annuus TaxID=4232 RepID=UPI000B8F9BA7|nr:serine/threonine-protein phosphatase 7 long form homolog [Helianthus annuus]
MGFIDTNLKTVAKKLSHKPSRTKPHPSLSTHKKISKLKMSYQLKLNPGPLSNEVLFLHKKHRALEVYNNPEKFRSSINIKRSDRSFWKLVRQKPIGPRVEGYIREAGFGGLLDSGYRYIDHALITALVEQWRHETHTFHLPVGETTVTLQDVNVLWGLPIEGVPVCGADNALTFSEAAEKCERLLGFTPANNQLNGCTVFPDNSNNWINLHLLQYLEDLSSCVNISWGSAVLSCLYRNLCNATAPDAVSLSGPMSILQVWAWERIRCVAPEPYHRFNYDAPLAARWKGNLNHVDAPTHCLRSYRSQLQSVREEMFIWTRYDDVIGRLPEICTSGSSSWRSTCPLIYWENVEHHYPQRVMRQFGMVQHIPPSIPLTVEELARLHKTTWIGKTGWDWTIRHDVYVYAWYHRHDSVVEGETITSYPVIDDYMSWFMNHTVLYLTNPRSSAVPMRGFQDDGARAQMLTDAMGVIQRCDDLELAQAAAYRATEMSRQEGYSQYPSHKSSSAEVTQAMAMSTRRFKC